MDKMNNIMKRLQEPFKSDEIEWRVGATNREKTKGMALAYVTNRAIQNRLDEVFGIFGWKNEFKEWKGKSQLCGISVWVEDRNEWITKWDGSDDSNMDSTKGGLSDAMKRCAYQWGIGRYLYNLNQIWVPIEACGKSYKITEKPRLPAWALPKGFMQEKQEAKKEVKEVKEAKEAKKNFLLPEDDGFKAISQKQRNRLMAIATSRGLSTNDIKNFMLGMFNIDSSTKLDSNTSYKRLVEEIESLPIKNEKENGGS